MKDFLNNYESLFQTVDAAFLYLENFTNFEKRAGEPGEYRLDRMAALLEICGNPQNSCPAIHVAGSKGKGSTVHFCASILQCGGYRVGIYTSPHLADYRERICSPEGYYPDQTYINAISHIRHIVLDLLTKPAWQYGEPTTFELLTLTAYLIFQTEQVDWMVIETGLGGRLDATNLMASRACLITALELEHTDVLGDTIEKISREKAGIFRSDSLLLTQEQEPAALAALTAAAQSLGTPLIGPVEILLDPDVLNHTAISFSFFLPEHSLDMQFSVQLSALGYFQHDNAELAARCIAILWDRGQLPQLATPESLSIAICDGLSVPGAPGRLQVFLREYKGRYQEIFLDGAHTPRSVSLVYEYFMPTEADILLFGSVSGKLHEQMAHILGPGFGQIVVSTPGSFKKSDPVSVAAAFEQSNRNCDLVIEPEQAVNRLLGWLESHPGGRGLVCGSFYMAGAVLPYLYAAGFVSERRELPCP